MSGRFGEARISRAFKAPHDIPSAGPGMGVGSASRRHVVWGVAAVLLLMPFIQLGYTYYVSVQVLAFACLAFLISPKDLDTHKHTLVLVLTLMLMSNLHFVSSEHLVHSILKNLREFVGFAVLLLVVMAARRTTFSCATANVEVILTLLIIGTFALTVAQYFVFSSGHLVIIPANYYVFNAATLPTHFELLHGTVRPSASFGEPSYLGFIATSMLSIVLHQFGRGSLRTILIVALCATVLLAQTLAGLLAGAALFLTYWLVGNRRFIIIKTLGLSLAILTVGSVIYALVQEVEVVSRLSRLADPASEASGYVRLILPLKATLAALEQYPLGLPTNELPSFLRANGLVFRNLGVVEGATDNAFLNFIINYGYFAALIGGILALKVRHPYLLMYFFVSSMYNGAFFSLDKVSVMGVTVFLVLVSPSRNPVSQSLRTMQTHHFPPSASRMPT